MDSAFTISRFEERDVGYQESYMSGSGSTVMNVLPIYQFLVQLFSSSRSIYLFLYLSVYIYLSISISLSIYIYLTHSLSPIVGLALLILGH